MKSSLFQYDVAMYNRLHALYDEIFFASPEECFMVNAKNNGGRVVMPFISVWRLPDITFNPEMFNDSLLRTGFISRSTKGDIEFPDRKVAMHGLPVTLSYQIDVYATKRDVCDGLTAELFLEFKTKPFLAVQVMDMGEKLVEFNMEVDDSISDNTDISGFDDTNRFYRLTITVNLPEALIYRIDEFPKVEKVLVDMKDMKETKSEA